MRWEENRTWGLETLSRVWYYLTLSSSRGPRLYDYQTARTKTPAASSIPFRYSTDSAMVKELRGIDNEERRRNCFRKRRPTLFAVARDLSEEFGAHVAVVAFSPTGEPHAFGGPTADSVLRTYLSANGPPSHPPPHSLSPDAAAGVGAETAGEAAARVAGMRREEEETKVLVAAEWTRVAAATEKVRATQVTAQKKNWWEVDVEALGEEELPVFVRALEMLKAEVQDRVDAIASARLSLPWREKKQQ